MRVDGQDVRDSALCRVTIVANKGREDPGIDCVEKYCFFSTWGCGRDSAVYLVFMELH